MDTIDSGSIIGRHDSQNAMQYNHKGILKILLTPKVAHLE
jgi:hypothetical protein